jgi:hypothetical protein
MRVDKHEPYSLPSYLLSIAVCRRLLLRPTVFCYLFTFVFLTNIATFMCFDGLRTSPACAEIFPLSTEGVDRESLPTITWEKVMINLTCKFDFFKL